jgi:hypothetical protein
LNISSLDKFKLFHFINLPENQEGKLQNVAQNSQNSQNSQNPQNQPTQNLPSSLSFLPPAVSPPFSPLIPLNLHQEHQSRPATDIRKTCKVVFSIQKPYPNIINSSSLHQLLRPSWPITISTLVRFYFEVLHHLSPAERLYYIMVPIF